MVEVCDNNVVLEREQLLLDSTNNLFNISTDASAPMTGINHTKETKEHFSKIRTGEGNPMYGKKRKSHVVKAMQKARWSNGISKKERVLRRINRKLRKEIIIERESQSIRCISVAHAAYIIGVSQETIAKSIRTKRFKSKDWIIKTCEDKLYTDTLAENHLDLFDDVSFYPKPELVEMLKNL